jgi:DNA-binding NtrC family response regulator
MMPALEMGQSLDGVKPLDEVEREHILRALEITNGNRTQAAQLLKISIRTLRNKLNEYKLECLVA